MVCHGEGGGTDSPTDRMPVTDHIRQKLGQSPHKPGVYLMKDRLGTVIYVGKARDLRKRLSQYFQASRRMAWDVKFNALVDAIHDFDVHVVRSEPEALLLEGKLIKQFQPRYNVSFRDDKQFLLLKVTLNDPIPRFTLTRMKQSDGARYFGPFTDSGAIRRTLHLVRRQFNLRGCRPLNPDASDYKHCLYGNLKFCTAPCIGNVTLDQYKHQVLAACDFLSGQCREMADQLDAEMRRAAAAQDYEKAAKLRDTIADLRRATEKTREFVRVPYTLPVAIDPERDLGELARVLGLPAPPLRIEGFDISNISGTLAVASMVSFWRGRPDRMHYRRFKMKTVVGQDDFACIAEAVQRRYSRLLREGAGSAQRGEEEGNAVVGEMQRAVDELSRKTRRGDKASSEASVSADPGTLEPDTLHVQPDAPEEDGDPESMDAAELAAAEGAAPADEARTRSSLGGMPDLILIDGGKGQLNAAVRELAKLGLSRIPVIGLAKEFEEIYQPGESHPLRLGLDSPAVKLLQRVRDESHRVANSYNAQLRIRKISESILDDFPGMGETRKAALLKKFGSVQRIRMATLEELGEVPGFGGKAAAELKTYLMARQG